MRSPVITLTALLVLASTAHGADGDILNSTAFAGGSSFALTVTPFDTIYVPEYNGTTAFIYDLDLNVIGFLDKPAAASVIVGIAYVDPPGPAVASLFWLDGTGTIFVTDLGGILLDNYSLESPFPGGILASLTWDQGTNRMWSADLLNDVCFEFFLDGELTGNLFFPPASTTFVQGITKIGDGEECFDLHLAIDSAPNQLARVLPNGEVQESVILPAGAAYTDIAWHPTGSTGAEVVYATSFAANAIFEVEAGLSCGPEISFIRGDADGNGTFNALADGVFLLDHGFNGGPAPTCMSSADVDGNGVTNYLADAVYLLNHGFTGGPPPPPPYPGCGEDDTMDCVSAEGCNP